jgi:hypothetical protein
VNFSATNIEKNEKYSLKNKKNLRMFLKQLK